MNASQTTETPADELAAPVAPARPTTVVVHGDERVDPWHWLRDRDDPEVVAYLQAENGYTHAYMRRHAALEERLYAEIRDRTEVTDTSVPAKKGPWWYYARTVEGLDYTLHCRRHDPGDELDVSAVLAGAGGP